VGHGDVGDSDTSTGIGVATGDAGDAAPAATTMGLGVRSPVLAGAKGAALEINSSRRRAPGETGGNGTSPRGAHSAAAGRGDAAMGAGATGAASTAGWLCENDTDFFGLEAELGVEFGAAVAKDVNGVDKRLDRTVGVDAVVPVARGLFIDERRAAPIDVGVASGDAATAVGEDMGTNVMLEADGGKQAGMVCSAISNGAGGRGRSGRAVSGALNNAVMLTLTRTCGDGGGNTGGGKAASVVGNCGTDGDAGGGGEDADKPGFARSS
jgi:hypothetical protein